MKASLQSSNADGTGSLLIFAGEDSFVQENKAQTIRNEKRRSFMSVERELGLFIIRWLQIRVRLFISCSMIYLSRMKVFQAILMSLILVGCSNRAEQKSPIQEDVEPVVFPYEHTENIPEVDFALPFDKEREYQVCYINEQFDTLVEFNSNQQLNIIAFLDQTFIRNDFTDLIEKYYPEGCEVDFIVKCKGEQKLLPCTYGAFDSGIICFKRRPFDILINKQGRILANGEFDGDLNDLSFLPNAYNDFIDNTSKVTDSISKGLIQNDYLYTKRDSVMHYAYDSLLQLQPKFLSLSNYNIEILGDRESIQDYCSILSKVLSLESERVIDLFGNYNRKLYYVLSPRSVYQRILPPPPPPPLATEANPNHET